MRTGDAEQILAMSDVTLPEEMIKELLALDDALDRLAKVDETKARVVELRYFGGLAMEEVAQVLGLSAVTVEREWRIARSWVRREMVEIGTSQIYVSTPTKQSEMAPLTAEAESKLAEAWSNRELVATLMSENWTGWKLLVQLRISPRIGAAELGSALGIHTRILDSLLLRLTQCGALEKQHDSFTLTNRGSVVLENFEKAIGKTF